ncbi:DNA ligase 1-like isoform X3 [Diabrotica virgifera virgifera]|uniref:WH2 domain-containing protein n=1 Tax=Diabrotica virgifera virgifera TaxID=50390 RepID=A0ABM5IFH6_DIAVI|nr:DNA ligase 1-like isoform X3 [Diabrotica virgifera virgifera]
MPAGKESDSDTGTVKRTTFRPPWVKEGPNPLPTPATPWTLKSSPRKESVTETTEKQEYNPLAGVQLKKIKKAEPKEPQENGAKESFFQKPALKPVPQREKSPPKKDHKIHNLPTLQKASERVLKSPPRKPSLARSDTLTSDDDVEIDKEIPTKRNALVREASMRRLSHSNVPPPPPPPGMPPPPPAMPGAMPKKPLTDKQLSRLNKLKARPKHRPDWNNLLIEIESKKALKHVVCNDRSSPLLPEAKTADEHMIYKSEEPNVHNELLKQIESGIRLKKVKTNDRSKPVLDGLRKFRRQMTIEEQIQKSMSMASIAPEEIATDEIDEMDDIDKVRDDLQSTKQMLALELRNKEAQERENKRLLSRIQNLQAELEKEKSVNKDGGNTAAHSAADEKVIIGLKKEAEQARKTSQDLEKKYTTAAEELDATKAKMEELRRQNQALEKRVQDAMMGKRFSISDRKQSGAAQGSDDEFELEEPEEESDGEDTEEKREKRLVKEVKMLRKKLQSLKTKEDNSKKERVALREIIKKHQTEMKDEKKKYKQLKKEVDKMANLMKDTDEDEEDEEEEKEEAEEEESEEEEESSEEEESESDSEDTDSEKSQSEDEDAPSDKHKTNLTARTKRHENILNALKKGNFLLKTNAERLQDDLNKQKELTASLQEDLDSVLSELG